MRVRLSSAYDCGQLSGTTAAGVIVCLAMQKFGAIFVDLTGQASGKADNGPELRIDPAHIGSISLC